MVAKDGIGEIMEEGSMLSVVVTVVAREGGEHPTPVITDGREGARI